MIYDFHMKSTKFGFAQCELEDIKFNRLYRITITQITLDHMYTKSMTILRTHTSTDAIQIDKNFISI